MVLRFEWDRIGAMDQPQVRVRQISDSHCGVAALEILLRAKGVDLNQRQLAKLAGVEKLIYQRGVKAEDLVEAVDRLEMGLRLSFKREATLSDLELAVKAGHLVGVEWQGLFRDEDDDIAQKWARLGYSGHYSVVQAISLEKNVLVMTDPYRAFFQQDRVFSAKWFEGRWWDWNLVDVGGVKRWVKHRKTMFIVEYKN